jgi:hypothetical protein
MRSAGFQSILNVLGKQKCLEHTKCTREAEMFRVNEKIAVSCSYVSDYWLNYFCTTTVLPMGELQNWGIPFQMNESPSELNDFW